MSRKYSISQLWGDNVAFYEQFYGPWTGHPAIDLVYADRKGAILALYDGQVVRDDDDERTDLGVTVTYWVPELNIAFKHCHMAHNTVSVGDHVSKGQAIGVMGKTQTQYAHDHLECIVTDDNGYRIEDLGVRGRIDPLMHVLRCLGDPTHVDYNNDFSPMTWAAWQKANPEWVTGFYDYGPSTL